MRMMLKSSAHRLWLTISLLVNFGILGIFKYFNFFAESLSGLFAAIGFKADMPTLDVILPVGISFYTFQLSAYMIDTYRRLREHGGSSDGLDRVDLLSFLTFITFFPQLVAGPIERVGNLLQQVRRERKFDEDDATDGMRLLLWGLMKKMLLADNCAEQVDYIFAHYDSVSTGTLWLGALYFTFQIYGDFSGYSDMAVGSARLFGIRLTQNFLHPYFATSMQDFWRRWHVTLMSWLRDYVYIPLGGSRKGTLRKHFNILSVFLLSGLWHGAGWTYVCWGLFHALFYRVSLRLLTFPLVVIGWVIFRSPDMSVCIDYISGMFSAHALARLDCSRMPVLLILVFMLVEWRMKDACHPFQWRSAGWQYSQPVRFAVYLILFLLTVVYGGEKTQFIYFQF